MPATGTRWRQPALVCGALALAAHAALLAGFGWPAPDHRGGTSGDPHAVTARYLEDAPAPAAGAAPAPPAPEVPLRAESVTPQAASAHEAGAPGQNDMSVAESRTPPAFEPNGGPALERPDAPMPPEGVRLRVFVQVEAGGVPSDVLAGVPPGEAVPAPGYQKAAERALRQTQFKSDRNARYCFLVRFEPGTPSPELAWLQGAARDAARCLTGKQPPPQPLSTATDQPAG